MVPDVAVASVWATTVTVTGRASIADGMVLCGSSDPVGSIPPCATTSVRTMYSATPASSGACGGPDMFDPLVRRLATRWLSDPVPATSGLSDPCLDACGVSAQGCLTLALQIVPLAWQLAVD